MIGGFDTLVTPDELEREFAAFGDPLSLGEAAAPARPNDAAPDVVSGLLARGGEAA